MLRALVLALAGITTSPEEFRESALASLERTRAALLPEPVSEAQIAGLDEMERWLLLALD